MNYDTNDSNYRNEYVRGEDAPEIDYNRPRSDAAPEIPEEIPYHKEMKSN